MVFKSDTISPGRGGEIHYLAPYRGGRGRSGLRTLYAYAAALRAEASGYAQREAPPDGRGLLSCDSVATAVGV